MEQFDNTSAAVEYLCTFHTSNHFVANARWLASPTNYSYHLRTAETLLEQEDFSIRDNKNIMNNRITLTNGGITSIE